MGDLELKRLAQLFIPAEVVEKLSYTVQCSMCPKLLDNDNFRCEMGSEFCKECFINSVCKVRKWDCPESTHPSSCKVYKNFHNVTIPNLMHFGVAHMRMQTKLNRTFVDVFLTEELVEHLARLVQCNTCSRVLEYANAYFCTEGHLLCDLCKLCNCGKKKLMEKDEKRSPVKNNAVNDFCEIMNSLQPPAVIVKCLIEDCADYVPLKLIKRHVTEIHDERVRTVKDFTETSGKKRSRFYMMQLTYEINETGTFGLVSEKGDMLFTKLIITPALDLKIAITAVKLEEGTHAPCTIRLKRSTSFLDDMQGCEITFEVNVNLTRTQLNKHLEISNENILKNGPRESLPTLVIEIILGSVQDIDLKGMKALGSPWTPLQYQ